MAKRKYEYYTVATDMDECYVRDYREALSAFRRHKGEATLYGISDMGDFCVILSK